MKSMTVEKAEKYARYRMPYADEAVQFLLDQTGGQHCIIADLGAGTGLLTRHFIGRAAKVYAIEPEPAMRSVCMRELGSHPNIYVQAGVAEATGLPDQSVDIITAANAFHRFHPEAALREFRRILKPKGWLAFFSYHDDAGFFRETMRVAKIPEFTNRLRETRHTEPAEYFFGPAAPERHLFRQTHMETWAEYWGAVVSGMESPNEEEEWYKDFLGAHQKRFARLATDGLLKVHYSTELRLGQPDYAEFCGSNQPKHPFPSI